MSYYIHGVMLQYVMLLSMSQFEERFNGPADPEKTKECAHVSAASRTQAITVINTVDHVDLCEWVKTRIPPIWTLESLLQGDNLSHRAKDWHLQSSLTLLEAWAFQERKDLAFMILEGKDWKHSSEALVLWESRFLSKRRCPRDAITVYGSEKAWFKTSFANWRATGFSARFSSFFSYCSSMRLTATG